MKINITFLRDQNGNYSMKRLSLFLSLVLAGVLAYQGRTPDVFTPFLTFAGAMGGVSVAEFFKK